VNAPDKIGFDDDGKPAAPQSQVSALPLSKREKQMVELLIEDLTDKAIADRLKLTPGTARAYMKTIRRKLGVHSRVGVALAAVGYTHILE
jgi:non-specific serine/threonine protein kinase